VTDIDSGRLHLERWDSLLKSTTHGPFGDERPFPYQPTSHSSADTRIAWAALSHDPVADIFVLR
jgi:hypothetical protein